SKIHAIEQRRRAHPSFRLHGIPGRWLRAVKWHAHITELADQGQCVIDLSPGGAHRRNHEFQWGFHFSAVGAIIPKLRGVEEHPQHFADVSLFLQKCFRHAIDQPRRRIIRNETFSELERNEVRGLRTRGQPVQHFETLAFAPGLDAVTKYELWPRLVHAWIKL